MVKKSILFKRMLVFGILVLFIGCSMNLSTGIGIKEKSIKPINNGNILYVGGSGPNNYTSIQDAINDSVDGDTVFVYDDSSPYYEEGGGGFAGLEIDKSINLIGENKETTIIDGNNSVCYVISVDADWVTISGFTIQNCRHCAFFGSAGISLYRDFATITDNIITLNVGSGIRLSEKYHNITDNLITSNEGDGIWSEYPCYARYCIITDNTIIKNNYNGISIGGEGNIISGNNINENNNDGIANGGRNNIISGNNINENNNNGIRIGEHYNIITTNNISSNNNSGINVEYGNNNIFHHNNFRNNGENAYDYGDNAWDDGEYGNYWDDYTGEDNDGDGIGDTPYPIPGGDNEDRYPLMFPTCNFPPNEPIINGPTTGKPNTEYDFSFNTTDLNQDPVMYVIEWGDNTTDWTEYSDSGEEIMLKHKWSEKGDYTIKAKAIDIHSAESDWTEFPITIPRDKATNNILLLRILERFPLLQKLIQQLSFGL